MYFLMNFVIFYSSKMIQNQKKLKLVKEQVRVMKMAKNEKLSRPRIQGPTHSGINLKIRKIMKSENSLLPRCRNGFLNPF